MVFLGFFALMAPLLGASQASAPPPAAAPTAAPAPAPPPPPPPPPDHAKLDSRFLAEPKGKSTCWEQVKCLAKAAPWFGLFTHVCTALLPDGTFCNKLLKLPINNTSGIYITSLAVNHLRTDHPVNTVAGVQAQGRHVAAQSKREDAMQASGVATAKAGSSSDNPVYLASKPTAILQQQTLHTMTTLAREAKQKTSQAAWFVYCEGKVSKRMFDNPLFRNMIAAGDEGSQRTVTLSQAELKKYVQAEYSLFKSYLAWMLKECSIRARGNSFAVLVHDAGTLENKTKVQCAGVQFIPPLCDENLTVAIGCVNHNMGNKDAAVAETMQTIVEECSGGLDFKIVIATVLADGGAVGVGKNLDADNKAEQCTMHDGDKVGKSSVGDLTRSKMHKVVNPFPEGQLLMELAHKLACWFSYGNRAEKLSGEADRLCVCCN
jgi:hypothetical protein